MAENKPLIVFVADDDDDDIMLFKEAVEIEVPQIQVNVFQHGMHICSHIKQSGLLPDLIFLDINMPLMNGKECLKAIREIKRFDSVPIIMYSTSHRPEDIHDTFMSGANLYLKKPSSFNALQKMLHEVFQLHKNNLLFKTTHSSYLLNSSF